MECPPTDEALPPAPFPVVTGLAGILWIFVSGLFLGVVVRNLFLRQLPEGMDAAVFGSLCAVLTLLGAGLVFAGVRLIRGTASDAVVSGSGSLLLGPLVLGLSPDRAETLTLGGGLIVAGGLTFWGRTAYRVWRNANANRWRTPSFPIIVRVGAGLWAVSCAAVCALFTYVAVLDLAGPDGPNVNLVTAAVLSLGACGWSFRTLWGRASDLNVSGVALLMGAVVVVTKLPGLWLLVGCVCFTAGVLTLAGRAEYLAWRAGLAEGEGWLPRYPPMLQTAGYCWLAIGLLAPVQFPSLLGLALLAAFVLAGVLALCGKLGDPLPWGIASILAGGVGEWLYPEAELLGWVVAVLLLYGGLVLVDRVEYLAWKRSQQSDDPANQEWREPF
jgi:hypothetical protein